MAIFTKKENLFIYHYDDEKVYIEPWGKNSLRVRAFKTAELQDNNFALEEKTEGDLTIEIKENIAEITNGKICAKVSKTGKLIFYNQKGEILLEEYVRNRRDMRSTDCSALEIEARELKPILGGDYKLTMRFVSNPNEKIYGMGQYQQSYLDLKGTDLELAQRNSQATVPFALSSLGYGFLWNNPAIGRVTFGKNITTWEAYSTTVLDYLIIAGDTPKEIEETYADATGKVPMMPDYAMGFWQSKLRYQTQDELLEVAREHKRRNLPISVIVIDYFHWFLQGEWDFDRTYWPDPEAMVKELKEMGIELMVSIWPSVDYKSKYFQEMKEKGFLIRTDRGIRVSHGPTIHYDVTNPDARDYVWDKAKKNYHDLGVKIFWLDAAEPAYTVYDFDNYRYHMGTNAQIGNLYPVLYAKNFFDGMKDAGQENIVNLIRCAWAGSQKYGALVWSGDIHSSFDSLRDQIAAGLNMGIAGIPWWTTDIGGFHGGYAAEEEFHEVLIRWFEYGTFCPVMRLHGDRSPKQPQFGTTGGANCRTGADNEVWSYGEKVYNICEKYLQIREAMFPYIKSLMQEAHEKGTPVIRTMFYEFPEDEKCWQVEDAYLFGADILVAPILYAGATEREVYLPKGTKWQNVWNGEIYNGGETVLVNAPIDEIPLFVKYDGAESEVYKNIRSAIGN